MRNQRGITLIALVITIIVLLILAGVSIAMLTGDNGILSNATRSVSETNISEDREAAILDLNAAYTEYMDAKYVDGDEDGTFIDFLVEDDGANYLKDSAHYTVEYTPASTGEPSTPASVVITTKSTVTVDGTDTQDTGTVGTNGGITWTIADAEDDEGGE